MRYPKKDSRAVFASLLIVYGAAIVLRSPPVVFSPNFWGEEGAIYFSFAFSHGWIQSLLQSPMGYLSLWTNIACTTAAKLVPLELAPYVTMLFAFSVQMVPAAIVLSSKAELWEHHGKKLLGLLIILFTLSSQEVWLNTINSQFYFALIVLLILLEPDDRSPARRIVFRALLLIAGLTGPLASLLFPLYLWSLIRGRTREKAIQVSIQTFCIMVQMAFIYFIHGGSNRERVGDLDIFTFVSILWTRLALVFTGSDNAMAWADLLKDIYSSSLSKLIELMWSLLLLVEALLFAHLFAGVPTKMRVKLFGSFVLLFLSGIYFAVFNGKAQYIDPMVAQRYSFVPNVLLLLMTLAALDFRGKGAKNIRLGISLLLCASGLFHGIKEYRTILYRYMDGYPEWTQEVASWRMDSQHKMRIWPAGWTMDLGSERSKRAEVSGPRQ